MILLCGLRHAPLLCYTVHFTIRDILSTTHVHKTWISSQNLPKIWPSWATPNRPPIVTCDSSCITQPLCPKYLIRCSCRHHYIVEEFLLHASLISTLLLVVPLLLVRQSSLALLSPFVVAPSAYHLIPMKF